MGTQAGTKRLSLGTKDPTAAQAQDKTRYNRSETPPDDIKTQVIYTEKGMSMLLFFPVISKYPERSLYSHTNSHNNVATQCHVDDAHRELGLPVTLRSLTDRVKAGVKQWKQRWRF